MLVTTLVRLDIYEKLLFSFSEAIPYFFPNTIEIQQHLILISAVFFYTYTTRHISVK